MISCQGFMALLHKADFIYENITQWHRLFRVFPKEVRSTLSFITFHHQPSSTTVPVHQRHLPESPSRKLTLHLWVVPLVPSFLIIPLKLFYGLIVLSQVVRNRGHGFSKRFNPAGVHCVYLRYRPAHCLHVALFRGKPAEWERLQPLPCLRLTQDHQWR